MFILFIPHEALRVGVRDGGARLSRCHLRALNVPFPYGDR